ncbi:MAG: RluA family pseudouridine synthase [Terrimicrobiaceae bacterium]
MPNQAEFRILGETEEFLAVDKPAGLLVHPTKPGGPRTLWDGVCDLLGYELATGGQVSIVNRLDRETSGVVVIAKTALAARLAGLAMQAREFHKEYLALVFGWPGWDELEIDEPIIRLGEVARSELWLERAVHPSGSPACTRFRVVRREQSGARRFALVKAVPVTGRTHQIRVHLAHLGFPVIGDKIYARGRQHYLRFIETGWTPELEAALWMPRHALHCTRMEWQDLVWESSLPEDLANFSDTLPPSA